MPVATSPDFDGTFSVFKIGAFQREFCRFVLVIVFFYLNLYIFLPRYYSTKRYILFGTYVLISFLVMVILPLLFENGQPNTPSHLPPPPHDFPPLEHEPMRDQPPMQPPVFQKKIGWTAFIQYCFSPLLPFNVMSIIHSPCYFSM